MDEKLRKASRATVAGGPEEWRRAKRLAARVCMHEWGDNLLVNWSYMSQCRKCLSWFELCYSCGEVIGEDIGEDEEHACSGS